MASSTDATSTAEPLAITSVQVAGQELAGQEGVEFDSPAFVPSPLAVEVSPSSVEVGIDCGMPDMCGLDPCLCGAADSWGACACNGLQEVGAELAYSTSDASVATVEQAFGRTWIVPHGQGDAVVTISADLMHYEQASCSVHVHVGGTTGADACVAGGMALAAAIVIAVIVLIVKNVKGRKKVGEMQNEDK